MVVEVIGSRPPVGESYRISLRIRHDRAGNRDAPPHASGQLRGKLVQRVLQLDEAQRLFGAGGDLIVRQPLLHQPVADVVAHVERVEQRALLKDRADGTAQLEQVRFAHGRDFLAEDENPARVRPQQAVHQFEQHALAHAGRPQQDAHLAGAHLEGDVLQHRLLFEADGDIFEDHDRFGA